MININQKAQTWSIDIALAAVVFMVAFLVFYELLNTSPNTKVSNLKEEASTVIKQFASEGAVLRVVDNDKVNVSKLNELKNLSYDELKRRLRLEGDFCLYFEDEKGYIVLINNSYKGVGAPAINLSGTPCSQK